MNVDDFLSILDADFFAGVPDSLLKPFVSALMVRYGRDPQYHVIAANEGNAAAIAAGYHLATGRVPLVYMQNSGIGNAVNPLASLLSPDVYQSSGVAPSPRRLRHTRAFRHRLAW